VKEQGQGQIGAEAPDGVVRVDGRTLSLEAVESVASGRASGIEFDPEARGRAEAAHRVVQDAVTAGTPVYGVTTGFGRMADVAISRSEQTALQENLIRSHAAGVGPPLSKHEVRALMLLRANALARGFSGCRPSVIDRLILLLTEGFHPRVPECGSVGASGDLAPLAHIAITLIGEGDVEHEGEWIPAREAWERIGEAPLTLQAKEGLSLINGTQATTGLGILAYLRAERALEAAECAGAMTLEALEGTPAPFAAEVQDARPHSGQRATAARMRALLRDSEIRESHREGDPRIQDAYSLRCIPQVHGAARQGLGYIRSVLEVEANSATDNPLIFPESGTVVSAGNFHAQIVAQSLDLLCILCADLASISERRIERLLNPDLNRGMPGFLAAQPGLESGFMIAQVAAVDLIAEMRVLAHPASVDSIPTSGNQEDHVSMGMAAARKARRAVFCLEHVIGIELACAAQGLEHRRPLKGGVGVEFAYRRVRECIPPLTGDRVLSGDLEAMAELVRSGVFSEEGSGFDA
jgi:histidine ammonia-lyase